MQVRRALSALWASDDETGRFRFCARGADPISGGNDSAWRACNVKQAVKQCDTSGGGWPF